MYHLIGGSVRTPPPKKEVMVNHPKKPQTSTHVAVFSLCLCPGIVQYNENTYCSVPLNPHALHDVNNNITLFKTTFYSSV